MEITQTVMEENLMFLTESDTEYGRLRALLNGLDRQTKVIKALAFRNARENSAAAREQEAYASNSYQDHMRKIAIAENELYELQERRNTACTTIDCWRSLNAARNRGNMM